MERQCSPYKGMTVYEIYLPLEAEVSLQGVAVNDNHLS